MKIISKYIWLGIMLIGMLILFIPFQMGVHSNYTLMVGWSLIVLGVLIYTLTKE
ncbi:hypothetical protein M2138_000880 [Dysgonomonadaceae bacterium PH5-43]|nr:hypothetical protein [Dysgonomonadaceae bacterium PH5-43]